jgi:hypothetical protein
MSDDSQSRPGDLPVLRTGPPPLRIHHFLIWTALTAAIISGCMTFDRWARNGPAIENQVIIAGLVLGAAVITGALTVVGSGIYWRRHGFVFPQSPGDWLLTVLAASVASFCGVFALFFAIFFTFGDDDWFPAYYLIVGALALVGWIRLHWIAIKRYADTAMWRTAFWMLMLSPFAAGLIQRIGAVAIAVIACVLWAAWSDWRKHIARSWTHWCGVAAAVSLGISLICVFGI